MREFITENKTKVILAGIGIIVVIIGIILVITIGNKNKEVIDDPTPTPTAEPTDTTETYDITGLWYSDQDESDTLELLEDGTYTSTVWLADGDYTVVNNKIDFVDLFGGRRSLYITNNGSKYTLDYSAGDISHTYYRSADEAAAVISARIDEAAEMQQFYKSALMQILLTGEWLSANGNSTLNFTDKDYTIVYTSAIDSEVITATEQYEIDVFEVKGGGYTIAWRVTNSNGIEFYVQNVTISVKGNTYTIHSGSFPLANTFSKTVEIDFKQPDPNDNMSAIIEQNMQYDQEADINTSDKHWADALQTVQNSQREFEAAVVKEIVGTWQGTPDEAVTDLSVYWIFNFTSTGQYTYSNGVFSETGTYNLGYNLNNQYHSAVYLQPADGEEHTINFYFSGTSPAELNIDGDTHPVYIKTGA